MISFLHRIESNRIARPSPIQLGGRSRDDGGDLACRACPAGARVYQTHTTTLRMRRTSCFNNSLPLFPFLSVDQRDPTPWATVPVRAGPV